MNHKEATEMTDWDTCPAVERTTGKVSGAWVFADTRIPPDLPRLDEPAHRRHVELAPAMFPCGRVRPASEND